jgi:hypothetical protein
MALSCKSPVVSPPVYLEGGRVNAYERSENIIIILKVSGYCQDGERVGNEATVSTRLAAGDGLVTKQLVFGGGEDNSAGDGLGRDAVLHAAPRAALTPRVRVWRTY